jgi:tRNA G18 (ribose-2'-O)-methylase SpoU
MKRDIYLILDNIRSRENVGSIFRTADAAGVAKIYLCGITPTPKQLTTNNERLTINHEQLTADKISKTALGAEKWVPWEYIRDTWRVVTNLNKQGVNVYALELGKGSVDIFKFKPKFPVAIVLGNEVKGISRNILKKCDKKIAIPMYGKKESLNVSVAAGIAVYQLAQ